jgi:hypothetical protein
LTFGIDKNGNPFYRVDRPSIKYDDIETLTLPNGKKVKRSVTKELAQEPIDKTPQECGWRKKVTFETVLVLHIANPKEHFKIMPQLFYRKYEVSAEIYAKHKGCSICALNGVGTKFHFLRSMPQGVYSICWLMAVKHGRSASGPIQLHENVREGKVAKWVKLIKERKIDKSEAQRILQRLQRLPSIEVRLLLEYGEDKLTA